ncbi:Tol [Fusarium mundagurra]|uniref:Tol n=1 Tax=Fusarium mundagurra TaxID=1567541 RepID=A0A8H5Y5L8_9HYPO|nr:Tol [Fusarium mundagurra]
MVSSHRRLVHRRNRQILSGKQRDLLPGEVRLFSYYAPLLVAGQHDITVSQTISAPPVWPYTDRETNRQDASIKGTTQSFYVVAPKFNLPPGIIDSVYPAPGSNAEVTVLPHVVFKDRHLPWERKPTYIVTDEDKGDERRRTPWLALLVFTVPELSIEPGKVKDVMAKLPPDVKREQSDTCALRMRARDLQWLSDVTKAFSYVSPEDDRDAAEPAEVILLEPDLFTALFSDDSQPTAGEQKLRVSKYKYLAHVRETATDGMAVAGNVEENDNDQTFFSVVISPRTSSIGADVPTTTIVHLVSLTMASGLTLPLPPSQRVAVLSLHSWTYTCLPSKNFTSSFDTLVNLGSKLTVLKPGALPEEKTPTARGQESDPNDERIQALIARREADGYTIIRHRTVTGEVTASITRGPFTPTLVPHPLQEGFAQSNFGTDLQILDRDLALMDLTYANAWQLGKSLAMGDAAFSAALARLRNSIHGQGLAAAKREVHAGLGGFRSRAETAAGMLDLVQGLNRLSESHHSAGSSSTAFDVNRWHHADRPGDGQSQDYLSLSRLSPHISSRLPGCADVVAARCSMASDGQLYNEYNMPDSPDYAHVYSWVLDKLHLSDVPAHYLIPDPSYLPEETLRFFHVDENWTDALIDGALSLANHWGDEPDRDVDRTAIKKAINTRLSKPDKALGGWHVQMPKYGFLLRSAILAQFPDLSVKVHFSAERPKPASADDGSPPPAQAPILVQKLLRPDTMYCLFDAAPPGLTHIVFTLPPHQQRFVVGQTLTETRLTVLYREISTDPTYKPRNPAQGLGSLNFTKDDTNPDTVFNWQQRTMNVENYNRELLKKLRDPERMMKDGKYLFKDEFITSAVLALHLNDRILELVIGDLNKLAALPGDSRFQLSTPSKRSALPPPLPRQSKPVQVPRCVALFRPRPPSPRLEAQLVAQHAESLRQKRAIERARYPAPPRQIIIADNPYFDFNIYPVRQREFVPSNTKLPIDLIFSLRQPDPKPFNTPLIKLVIAIPFGSIKEKEPSTKLTHHMIPHETKADDPPPPFTPLLGPNPDPPMPTMLSNMRFNIIKHFGTKKEGFENHLILEVIPRAAAGVDMSLVRDASFLMSGVEIALYEGPGVLEPKPFVHLLQYHMQYEKAPLKGGTQVVVKPLQRSC